EARGEPDGLAARGEPDEPVVRYEPDEPVVRYEPDVPEARYEPGEPAVRYEPAAEARCEPDGLAAHCAGMTSDSRDPLGGCGGQPRPRRWRQGR
ncbi:MAG: hypothetical protein FWH56_03720, partial [Betaproteobacteria bacterium]|nr:hypothetical protein [Betaproteobacteria bacterium]